MRTLAIVGACLLAAGPLAGQERPTFEATLRTTGADPPEAVVTLRSLLSDERFATAMESGFPLYVALTVELREERSLWDRTVDRWVWEYVVVWDPVREIWVIEDPQGTEEFRDRAVLARRLARVYVVPLEPRGGGRHHYRASARARMLSDEDVDEVYAWLRGDDAEAARRDRPGFLARTARKVLVQVAPLPRLDLDARTASFTRR